MQYIAYRFTVTPPQPGSEILMAMIADFGFTTFENTEQGFIAYIDEKDNDNVHLDELTFEDFTYSFTTENIEQVNWNSEWEKNFDPVRVGNKLLIRAPFHAPDENIRQEIVIMPKMSFGTGHHQTTQLMCAEMFEMNFENKRVLDMGCGTGVLAILAKKLGASDLLAIDIDEWSVENSIENCANNGAAEIVVKLGDVDLLETEKPFDVILANINKNILKAQIPVYSKKISAGGKLFLSGFFTTDVDELRSVAETHAFKFSKTSSSGEWAMLLLEKN